MTPTTLAAAILRDVPTRYQPVNGDRLLHESDVLAALTAAMDPALSERAGEVQKDLKLFRAVWGELPSVAPHIATAPGVTTGSVISACDRAASLITALLAQLAALRAERDEVSSKLEVERTLTDAVHRLAKAAEAERDALRAEIAAEKAKTAKIVLAGIKLASIRSVWADPSNDDVRKEWNAAIRGNVVETYE